MDTKFAIVDGAPERAVLRTGKGQPMKARLLKKWGGFYAGQVLTNVDKGSIPASVAEMFEDDDPAVMTVVEQHDVNDPLMVINDEINPASAKAHNEAQRSSAKASRAFGGRSGQADAVAELEDKQTQERARTSDELAAARKDAPTAKLTKGQIEKNAAGKGPRSKKAVK